MRSLILRRPLFTVFLVAIVFDLLLLVAFAQTAPAGPIDDAAATAWFARFSKWQLFLVPLVTVVVAAFKKAFTAIPSQAWPWLAPFVGVGLDYVGSKFGLWSGNAAAGAILGGLSTWFYEFTAQTKEFVAGKPGAVEGP